MLRPALPFGNRCEHQQDTAVGKIGADDDVLDPVENDGAGGGKKNFVLIGEQPTPGKRHRRSSRGRARTSATLGSITARGSFERTVFADPCSPAMAKTG